MMKKIALFLLIFLFPMGILAVESTQVPKDFRLVYHSKAGELELATEESVVVAADLITVQRDAVELSEPGKKKKHERTYKITPEDVQGLYDIVLASGFLEWPETPEVAHESQVDEYFAVTVQGKTILHYRWEQGHEGAFRKLFDAYNKWFTKARTPFF